MKTFLLLPLGVAALYDGFTTVLGIAVMIGAQRVLDYAFSVVGAIVILGFSLSARPIMAHRSSLLLSGTFKIFLVATVAFDFFTAFMANLAYVVDKRSTSEIVLMNLRTIFLTLSYANPLRLLVVLFVTIVVASSPLLLSFLPESDYGD